MAGPANISDACEHVIMQGLHVVLLLPTNAVTHTLCTSYFYQFYQTASAFPSSSNKVFCFYATGISLQVYILFEVLIPGRHPTSGTVPLSLHVPHLITQIFKEDGGVILTDFSSAADVGEVNAIAACASSINALVEDVNRLTLHFSGHSVRCTLLFGRSETAREI